MHLLGDDLIDGSVGHNGAGNLEGLDIIHGVLYLLSGLTWNVDRHGVADNLRGDGVNCACSYRIGGHRATSVLKVCTSLRRKEVHASLTACCSGTLVYTVRPTCCGKAMLRNDLRGPSQWRVSATTETLLPAL